jgi:four helix bundle protein
MSSILTYRDLEVWQKAMELAEHTYAVTKKFPRDERFGLTSQTQRAAVSIPANIAEGHARRSTKEYVHHLSIARGSLAELETHVILATRMNYISREEVAELWKSMQTTGRLLNGLMRKLSSAL